MQSSALLTCTMVVGVAVVAGSTASFAYRPFDGTDAAVAAPKEVEIAVPRARLDTAEGKTTEWKSKALRAYQRRRQRHGEPSVAQSEGRLGRMERPRARRRTDRPRRSRPTTTT